MSSDERTVYRYGDFPELFWDLQPDAEIDRENPHIIARLLEHAPPETIWKLIPVDLLLRDFEKLDLPEHTRTFWSVAVRMMREKRGIAAPPDASSNHERVIKTPPRLSRSERPDELPSYRYGDFTELFWDLRREVELDRQNPHVIARVLSQGSVDAIRKIVPMDVLVRDFEFLAPELTDEARRFWEVVVSMRRERLRSERGQAA